MKIRFSMPLYVEIGKNKKKYRLNLNYMQHWHHQVKRSVKEAYKKIAREKLKEFRFLKADKIELSFYLYKPSKRKMDRSNQLSVHEKYICDVMVDLQMLIDDDDSHIEATHYYTGGIDKDDPRVAIEVSIL